jgi:hypothetical protein
MNTKYKFYTLTSLNSFREIGAIFVLGGKIMSKYQNHQQLELLEREVHAQVASQACQHREPETSERI